MDFHGFSEIVGVFGAFPHLRPKRIGGAWMLGHPRRKNREVDELCHQPPLEKSWKPWSSEDVTKHNLEDLMKNHKP